MSDSGAGIVEAKRDMRTSALARRGAARARHGAAVPEAAMAIRLAAAGLLGTSDVVAAWLAIGEEIDAMAVLAGIGRGDEPVGLPTMVAKGQPLVFRLWRPGEPLAERMWGIREPLPEAREAEPDVLLVPLLAFDGHCRRLGYGGGFYDRTLGRLRKVKQICAIGLAFDEVEVDSVPCAAYDEPLDHVLTPTRLLTRPLG
ncbi:MAG: 5-formyltetrahydrofolate cyclo-ligase [Hyphomicrobiaceae bacterium]